MLAALPHTLLLVLSIVALGGAALRIASLVVPRGLARALSVVVFVAAAAAVEALIIRWVGLGMSPYALAAAAGLTWLVVRWRCHGPSVGLLEDGRAGWRALSTGERVALGTAFGAWVAWGLWAVARPALGYDMVTYHLPETIGWVQEGDPGTLSTLIVGLPVDAYPALEELIGAWAVAIGRTLVPFSLLPMVGVAVLATSFWLGLRSLAVPRLGAGLAAGAMCFVPTVLGWQVNGAPNDPATLAWLAACAALCAASRERPELLAPALVAAGLAIGTKATSALAVALVLGVALFLHRRALRLLAWPLAGAALLGGLVGLFWYARNLVEFGSPLWPFVAAPWGEPVPLNYSERPSFVELPVETIEGLAGYWRDQFAGPLLLFGGSALAVVVWPRRSVVACAAVAAIGIVAWMLGPFSGIEGLPVATFSSTRYMLPAIGAATVATALLATAGGWRRRAAFSVLAAACAIGVLQTLALDGFAPSPLVPLAGVVAGAAVGALASSFAAPASLPRLVSAGLLAAAVATSAIALAVGTSGYTQRHAEATDALYADVIRWLYSATDFPNDGRPVLAGPLMRADLLAGDRLEHRVELMPLDPDCAELQAAMREGYLITPATPQEPAGLSVAGCLDGRGAAFAGTTFRVDFAR